jgi:hypothetical protein
MLRRHAQRSEASGGFSGIINFSFAREMHRFSAWQCHDNEA